MSRTDLAAKIAQFKALSESRMQTVVQKSLIRTGQSVIVESPVDKGRFAANWIYAFGAADTSTKDGAFSGEAEKQGSISKLTTSINGLKLGQQFFMTNSLPYAQRLENGWSAKSSLMVARAVNNFPAVVADEVRKVK